MWDILDNDRRSCTVLTVFDGKTGDGLKEIASRLLKDVSKTYQALPQFGEQYVRRIENAMDQYLRSVDEAKKQLETRRKYT